jgi:hypothetical protein
MSVRGFGYYTAILHRLRDAESEAALAAAFEKGSGAGGHAPLSARRRARGELLAARDGLVLSLLLGAASGLVTIFVNLPVEAQPGDVRIMLQREIASSGLAPWHISAGMQS